MKRKHYASMALAMLLLSGCGNNEVPGGTPTENTDKKISLRTSIIAQEKTTVARSPELDSNGSGNFSDGDVFALQISSQAASECVNFDYTGFYTTVLEGGFFLSSYLKGEFCGLLSETAGPEWKIYLRPGYGCR